MVYFTEDWFCGNIPQWKKFVFDVDKRDIWKCLEIGSYQGRSCLWILENVNIESITCIDTFEGSIENSDSQKQNLFSMFKHNIEGYEDKVIIKRGYSRDVLKTLDEKYDFIYVDGSHQPQDVITDAVLSFDLLKTGGYMIFDDFGRPTDNSPAHRPILAFLEFYSKFIDIVHVDYQVIIKKIKPFP